MVLRPGGGRVLYFLTEPETGGSYFGMYNRAVRSQLRTWAVRFEEIPLAEPAAAGGRIEGIDSGDDDIWLLSCTHNPIGEQVACKRGRKYGHVHGLAASLYDPAVLEGYTLNEEQALGRFDAVFVNSRWARGLIEGAYPDLGCEVVVSGFPFDAYSLQRYRGQEKRRRMVVFNQRFALDSLHILEVHIAEILNRMGHETVHLVSGEAFRRNMRYRQRRVLMREGHRRGLRFVTSTTKAEYYRRLAGAGLMITTPLADTLSIATLEAAALGVTPVVPDWGPFPEYVPRANRYPPYNVDAIIRRVVEPPASTADFRRYLPSRVIHTYLVTMGVL